MKAPARKPPQEQPVQAPQTTPEPAQPAFSFMGMVQGIKRPIKSSRSKTIDPLTLAKTKILEAIKVQKTYVALVIEGKPLPKANGGDKIVSTWFNKQTDGWRTSIRYGQASIQFGAAREETDLLIGKLEDVPAFYDAVATAIEAGELDAQIGAMQAEKSASLRGK